MRPEAQSPSKLENSKIGTIVREKSACRINMTPNLRINQSFDRFKDNHSQVIQDRNRGFRSPQSRMVPLS